MIVAAKSKNINNKRISTIIIIIAQLRGTRGEVKKHKTIRDRIWTVAATTLLTIGLPTRTLFVIFIYIISERGNKTL